MFMNTAQLFTKLSVLSNCSSLHVTLPHQQWVLTPPPPPLLHRLYHLHLCCYKRALIHPFQIPVSLPFKKKVQSPHPHSPVSLSLSPLSLILLKCSSFFPCCHKTTASYSSTVHASNCTATQTLDTRSLHKKLISWDCMKLPLISKSRTPDLAHSYLLQLP